MSTREKVTQIRNAALRKGVFDAASAAGLRYVASGFNLLDPLAVAYCTDKSSQYHGYTEHYRAHFAPWRFRKLTLLEIGVGGSENQLGGGNSLRVWRDYFPRARVYGADLHEKRLEHLGQRITILQADQNDPEQLERVLAVTGTPDIIIDDGSHVGEHVWTSFRVLFPRLRPGGWYVVEDLHTSFMDSHGGSPEPDETTPIGAVLATGLSVQARDSVIRRGLLERPEVPFEEVAAVHIHPGIAFIRKAG